MTGRPGRPKGEQGAREALLEAARHCFTQQGYKQVSTRAIARHANVDAAMIRYYFGSKSGLFEALIRETIAPVLSQLQQSSQQHSNDPLAAMQQYYEAFGRSPDLPRLLFHSLSAAEGDEAFTVMSHIFADLMASTLRWSQHFQNEPIQFNDGIAPEWIRLSFASLMVFPLVMPAFAQQQLGVDLSAAGLAKLAQHNRTLFLNGLIKTTHEVDHA